MTAKKLGECLLIWLLASSAFVAVIVVAFFIIDRFAPRGDAGFGYGLGMIPSVVAAMVGYLVLTIWALFSSYAKPETLTKKLRYYGFRALLAGGIFGGLIVLNGVSVFRKYFLH